MPRRLDAVEKTAGSVLRLFSNLASWMLLPMIAVIMFDVVARKIPVIQHVVTTTELVKYVSSIKLQEWEWHLHTVVFALTMGWAFFNDRHVRVGLWRDRKSERTKAIVDVLGILFLLTPFLVLLLIYGTQFVVTSYSVGEGSGAVMGLSNRWIIKAVLLLGFVLLFLSAISVAARSLAVIVRTYSR